jgi:TolA-binding protein
MRFTRYATHTAVVCATLLAPFAAFAAPSKEMQDLQRDVAMLSDQVMAMQKANENTLSSLEASIKQISDSLGRTNTTVTGLNSTVVQTLQGELKTMRDQLAGVSGLSVKLNNISEDMSNVLGSVKDMQAAQIKQGQAIADLTNQIKLMQAPAPAPPPLSPDGTPESGPESPFTSAPPQPSPQTLFENDKHDLDASRFELARTGFEHFLRVYPDDASASAAQYNIGNSYYSQADLTNAVKAYDAVIERYPKDETTTPKAYYMKGMALKKMGRNQAAIASFQAVIRTAPKTDDAAQATQQLHSMGIRTKKTSR